MLKLLIVDDEDENDEKKSLSSLLCWKEYGISEVLTAENASMAVDLMNEHPPDILISGMKMNGMTGLQLAKAARQKLPNIKIVFISGYGDFEFVEGAVRIHAYDYILKPVHAKELASSIENVISDIELENKTKEEKEYLTDLVNESRPLLRHKLLTGCLYGGETNEREALERIDSLGLHIKQGPKIVLLVEVDDYKTIERNISINNKISKLHDVFDSIVGKKPFVEAVQVEKSRYALIVTFDNITAKATQNSIIRELSENIIKSAREESDLSVTVGVGCFVEQVTNLYQSYQESSRALSNKLFEGKGRTLFLEKTVEPQRVIERQVDNIDTELAKCLLNRDVSLAHRLLDGLFDKLRSEKVYDSRYIQDYCINIISRIQITMRELNVETEDVFGHGIILLEKLMNFETILDIRQWMKNVFGAIIEYLKKRDASRNSKMIETILNYISGHYGEEITLKGIAEKLYYTPNYLGNIFKQEIGKSFSDYLTEYRMRRAAEMLEKKDIKTYEAAILVGYKNISSFIRQFKCFYGVTPTEYKGKNAARI